MIIRIMILLLATACGIDESTESSVSDNDQTEIVTVESRDDLPECAEANQDQLARVKSENLYLSCSENGWEEVEVEDIDMGTHPAEY